MSVTLCTVISDGCFDDSVISAVAGKTRHDEFIIADCTSTKPDVSSPHKRVWFSGYNLYYGGALNQVISNAMCDVVVYFSCYRSRLYDPTWIEDMKMAVVHEKVGMAGSLQPCDMTCLAMGNPGNGWHVQGGVWSARTEVLRRIPYSPRFPHIYSDVSMSLLLMQAGYSLADVPSVKSVSEGVVDSPAKFIVDYLHARK